MIILHNHTEYVREWNKKNRERSREISRNCYHRHPEYKKSAAERVKKTTKKLRQIILEHFGSCCSCCGEAHKEFLVIDHVNGGGSKEFRKFSSMNAFYKHIINNNFPKEYQILCANCNTAKGTLKQKKCPVHGGMKT